LKKYVDKFDKQRINGGNISLKNLVDTAHHTLRIRMQMKDVGSYKVADKVDSLRGEVDEILNPDKKELERLYSKVEKGDKSAVDSILFEHTAVFNNLISLVAKGNEDLEYAFNMDPEKINTYRNKPNFNKLLRTAIDQEYYDLTFTGTSVVAAEGTKYLFINLVQSLVFAIISIALLMAFLFRSFTIILISMIPNIIPLLFTAGIMGLSNTPFCNRCAKRDWGFSIHLLFYSLVLSCLFSRSLEERKALVYLYR